MEDEIKVRAKENMAAGGGDQKSGLTKLSKAIKQIETRKELAKLAGLSVKPTPELPKILTLETGCQ